MTVYRLPPPLVKQVRMECAGGTLIIDPVHVCATPGWWVRWRMGIKPGMRWECSCGQMWIATVRSPVHCIEWMKENLL